MSKNKHTDPVQSTMGGYKNPPSPAGTSGLIDGGLVGGPKGSLPTKPFCKEFDGHTAAKIETPFGTGIKFKK